MNDVNDIIYYYTIYTLHIYPSESLDSQNYRRMQLNWLSDHDDADKPAIASGMGQPYCGYIRTIYTFRWFCELWMEWQCSEWCGSTNLTDSMMYCTFWAGNRLNRSDNGHNSFTTFILYSYISCVTTWTFSLSPNYFLLIRRHNRHISMEL